MCLDVFVFVWPDKDSLISIVMNSHGLNVAYCIVCKMHMCYETYGRLSRQTQIDDLKTEVLEDLVFVPPYPWLRFLVLCVVQSCNGV